MIAMGGAAVPVAHAAATITGVVRDAVTSLPLVGIDVDVLDDRLRLIGNVNAATAANGSYSLGPLGPGNYYVRADATLAQGYCDAYWPGVFLPTQALTVSVPSNGTVPGIDLALAHGRNLSGHVRRAGTAIPVAGIDLDLYGSDGSLLSSVDAFSAGDGSYLLGALPPDFYYVKADPTPDLMLVRAWYPDAPVLALATAVTVTGAGDTPGVDFALRSGGNIAGHIRDALSGLPVADIDLDVFDTTLVLQDIPNDVTDSAGNFLLGSLPPGDYYVLADPDPTAGQEYLDVWYQQAYTLAKATRVTVTTGATRAGVDFVLSPPRFISGTVRHATTSAPLFNVDLDLLDADLNLIAEFDAKTLANGTYVLGPLPVGQYKLRADATLAQGVVDRYWPGVFAPPQAQLLTIGANSPTSVDFALPPGGTIAGTVVAEGTSVLLTGIDMDIIMGDGTPIPSVDADTDAVGAYVLGCLPAGSYYVQADATALQGYAPRYYPSAELTAQASLVTVVGSGSTTGITITLPATTVAADPLAAAPLATALGTPWPNPFSSSTTVRLAAGLSGWSEVAVYDARGRRVRTLLTASQSRGSAAAATSLRWDGRDDAGAPLASGVYYLNIHGEAISQARKVLLTR